MCGILVTLAKEVMDKMPRKKGRVLSTPVYGDPADWAPRWALDAANDALVLYKLMQGRKLPGSMIKGWTSSLKEAEKIFRRIWPLLRYRKHAAFKGKKFWTWQSKRLTAAEHTVELLREAVAYLEEFLKPGRPVNILLGNAVADLVKRYEEETGAPHYHEVGIIITDVFKDVLPQKLLSGPKFEHGEWARKVATRHNRLMGDAARLPNAHRDLYRQIL